jgi:hypothetical protein
VMMTDGVTGGRRTVPLANRGSSRIWLIKSVHCLLTILTALAILSGYTTSVAMSLLLKIETTTAVMLEAHGSGS